MTVKVDKIEKNRVAMEVTVQAEDYQKAYDKALKKVAGKINLPGFRKGKAPRALIESRVGKEAIVEESYDFILSEAYSKAVEESGIEPVDRPQVEIVSAEPGTEFVFKATVVVKPEVELGQYKELGVERNAATVTDEQMEEQLNSLQQRYAKVSNLEEGTIVDGDTATIDFEGFVDGKAFPGGKGTDYPLVIGSGSFIPGFEEQLVGIALGAELDVNVTFPEEYHATDLAGKAAVFKVSIKGIKRKELTPLDDEFAKDVSEFATLEELKTDIRNKLLKAAEDKAERDWENAIVDKAVEGAVIDLPPAMIDQRVSEMVNEMAQRLQAQGLEFNQYLEYTGSNVAQLQEQYRPQAEHGVRTDLVLEAVANAEGIDVSDAEVEEAIVNYATKYRQDPGQFRKLLEQRGELKMFVRGVVIDKAVKFLVANN
ncbi:MAG: trigger factor [Peptococcaceae bacterium]|nr:trigger factor [Peptococcaceae bacterium]